MSEKKSVVENYIYNMIFKIFQIISPIITTPYLSRILGVDNIGIYNYVLAIVSYFVLLATLGMNMYGQREMAACTNNSDRNIVFSELTLLRIMTMCVSFFIYFLFITSNLFGYKLYFLLFSLEILANGIDVVWVFNGLEQFKIITIRNVFVRVAGIVAIFLFVKERNDLLVYILIHLINMLVGSIVSWVIILRYVQFVKVKFKNIISHFIPVVIVFLPQVIDSIYMYMDKSMLGWLSTMAEVGIYSQADKIMKLLVTVITSMGLVISPKIVKSYVMQDNRQMIYYLNKSIYFVWLFGAPMIGGILVAAPNFVTWFLGEEFLFTGNIMIYMSPIIIFMGLNSVLGWQYLLSIREEKKFLIAVILGAAANFIINYIFIPKHAAIGAVGATVFSMGIMTVVNLISVGNVLDYKVICKKIYKVIFSAIVMTVILKLIDIFKIYGGIWETMIQVIIGAGIYFILLLILRDQEFLIYFRRLILMKNNIINRIFHV